ncbi:glyceraldehyde-3-phosphate dehydrogenase, type I [Anncaliia algerae PRA339]|uniref:Glyceraldehyde-3-phosphate dehydrogenase n=1 Tax=Anncaliia algerae PRA339 TaxID=1288291 RepID=A0A059F1L6_9MICR|nr:glyceraldehyde-3-phosphate dehydrogenase, type I [Anncaliia algerae PRA339]
MSLKIGINGFGRIGKLVHRVLTERSIPTYKINDPFITIDYAAYSMTYDSTHGRSNFKIEKRSHSIVVNGNETLISLEKAPEDISWDDCDIVIEASGVFTTVDKCKGHLKTAKKVIITAPSEDAPMFVYGVNHENYKGESIFSNASCTTNCLAPLAKLIHDNFIIVDGLMTTVHALTNSQSTLDVYKKKVRSGRSCNNIIPATTGAAKAVTKVIPELEGRINGMAFRVPVDNVSVIDFVFQTEKETSLEYIFDKVKEATQGSLKGIMCYTTDEVVSSDYNGCSLSCVVDCKASMQINSTFFKIIAWYDNEYGYSCRVVDMIKYTCNK